MTIFTGNTFLRVFFTVLLIIGLVTGPGESASADVTAGSGPISVDFREADLRDALSALAIHNGVSVILTEEPVKVTFQAKDVSPRQALELLLQAEGLAYIQQGETVIVGKTDSLTQDFFNQMILTRFNLLFISAETLEELAGKLSIPVQSIALDTNPHVIWAQGTPQGLHKLQELIQAVDRPDSEVSLEYRTITATQASPVRLVELLGEAGLPTERYMILGSKLMVFDKHLLARWDQVESLLRSIDSVYARENTVFVYPLKNMVAADAEERLQLLNFEGLETVTFNYPELTRELLVICPPHLEIEVRGALNTLDGTRESIRVPVASATGEHARSALHAQRNLIHELTDVPVSHMHISSNLSGDRDNPHYVLWVEESPETVRQIENLISRFE